MSYHTRNQRAQRYNKPGTFIPSQQDPLNNSNYESQNPPPLPNVSPQSNNFMNLQQQQTVVAPLMQQQQTLEAPPLPPLPPKDEYQGYGDQQSADDTADFENGQSGQTKRKPWMRPEGVSKISNRERRRRQNERLTKVLIPKNALMVLNELNHGDVTFDVKEVNSNPKEGRMIAQYMASLNTTGTEYKGIAPSKVMARNVAAEQAIRDLILKKLEKQEKTSVSEDGNGDVEMKSEEDDTIPIIKLASFALHKLFSEWQAEGFKIPAFGRAAEKAAQSKGSSVAGSDVGTLDSSMETKVPKKPKEPKQLPADAAKMHPCMLLSQMRPNIEYQEISVEGDKPQNTMFTLGVNIDGVNYIGRASNKKEARKNAARSACQSIFSIQYENQQDFLQTVQ